jgi:hypothetical protein
LDRAAAATAHGAGCTPLGHRVGDATEQAYRRGDALERRRKLMAAWAAYCERPGADVAPLRALR